MQGDRVCDVCKGTISNLPEITPPAPMEAGSDAGNSIFDDIDERNHPHGLHGAFVADQMPGSADIVFDCIRVRGVDNPAQCCFPGVSPGGSMLNSRCIC